MQTITSRENPLIKQAVRLRESARERRRSGLFFLEGHRLCADALASGYAPELLLVTPGAMEKYPINQENFIQISDSVAQKLADTQSPQGVFGVFRGRAQDCDFTSREQGKFLALEQLQDPGNLGAAARTAEALGLDGLIVSGGCDPYHPKALRSSMGALLRLPLAQTDDLPGYLQAMHLPCYAAVPDPDAQPLTACDFSGSGAVVVIGNEGSGLSDDTIAACGQRVTIPMRGRAESLNAAAAATILMWQLTMNNEQ